MTHDSIKEAFDAQIARARFAFREGLYGMCKVLLYGAEKMAENMEKLNAETLKHTKKEE